MFQSKGKEFCKKGIKYYLKANYLNEIHDVEYLAWEEAFERI